MTEAEQQQNTVPKGVSNYLANIGAKGGASGTGEAKRRPKSHYSRAGKLGAKARRLKKRGKGKVINAVP